MNTRIGKIYLIPCPITQGGNFSIPAYVREVLNKLTCFFVENERSARRFLKSMDPSLDMDQMELFLMNENHPPDLKKLKDILIAGKDIGVISDAGCPAVADPGNLIVRQAHHLGARVIPMVGPSSILLALIASGLNGQQFQFVGYLPIPSGDRIRRLRELEIQARRNNQTQIFMETPYRNAQMIRDILEACQEGTSLCIAASITGEQEFIRTLPIGEWKKNIPSLGKVPAIYLLGLEI
ncbi:MAG: SAM-dependent methyltransferase [Chitinophagaceae bacterium]